jgi:hypothetical protein
MASIIDDLKESSSFAPYVGAYFILYGAVDLITFYGEFNISIIHFITFSEIISYFIKDITVILTHLLLLVLGVVLIKYFLINSFDKTLSDQDQMSIETDEAIELLKGVNTESPSPEEEERMLKAKTIFDKSKALKLTVKRKLMLGKIILWLILLFIGTLLIFSAILYGWMGFFRIASPFALIVIINTYIKQAKTVYVVYGFCTLLTSAYFNAVMNAEKIKSGSNYGLDFQIGNDVFKSDSTNFVIGKTENFMFYYRSKERNTIVYPASKIELIKIPDRHTAD